MRKKKKEDPFGLNRRKKAFTLKVNKMRGESGEIAFKVDTRLQGHDVKRTPRGRDFEVQERDFWGRKKGKPYSVEVKKGDNAKVSKLQKKRKKKEKGRYKVVRY
ncbi:MAG: hypothetical protein PVH73_01635 [Candidatus Bathyarchaeota archaeon]|jgi:hypothetical protein